MSVKLKLRFEGVEYPAAVETTAAGAPKMVWLTEAASAPAELAERVEGLSWMLGLDGGWAAIRSLAHSSPRYDALIERLAEACAGVEDENGAAA